MTYLELFIRLSIVAALVGGLHYWARYLARNCAPRIPKRHPENTFFHGGKL